VRKFPQAKATIGALLTEARSNEQDAIDLLKVEPFKGYEEDFRHRGYTFFLRQGFKPRAGLRTGNFIHDDGWEVNYQARTMQVPAGVQVTAHVSDPETLMEISKSRTGGEDIRTVANRYKKDLTCHLDQFYMLVNGPYMKKMNRAGDIAVWDGWEFFIRAQDYSFGCVVLRREFIPPLCDSAQVITILLRCPSRGIDHEMCEVLIDECRFVADSLAPVAQAKQVYTEFIQARLDSLQCTEEAYRWFEGTLGLKPLHKTPAALKFVKSILKKMDQGGVLQDETILDSPILQDVALVHDPMMVCEEMLSDAEALLGNEEKKVRDERRNAWFQRISKYLAFCVDGGILGERFTLGTFLQGMMRGAGDSRELRKVLEFMLHLLPRGERGDFANKWSTSLISLAQLLHEPQNFGKYSFNRIVLRCMVQEDFLKHEWRRINKSSSILYETLLANLLTNPELGLSLKTLICRQILENTSTKDWSMLDVEAQIRILVPALLEVTQGSSVALASCATAALVNLSCGKDVAKNMLVHAGALKLCMTQLKSKDDDLTLYTLYLLVNLTKTAHHRAIVVREGGVPLLVELLTSSYQNVRKQKILTEIASVIGQLCNDEDSRTVMSEDFPVVICLLWINEQAPMNTKVKAKVLFALRQLAVFGPNKIKIGQTAISNVIEQISAAKPKYIDCLMNAVMLLLMLSPVRTNIRLMTHQDRLADALETCGLTEGGRESKSHRFGPAVWEKVAQLQERIAVEMAYSDE